MKSENTLIALERESTDSIGLGTDDSRARHDNTVSIDEIQRPGVSSDMLKRARIRQVEATEAQNLTGTAEAGILIPYLGINGRPIYDQDTPFYVLRLHETKNNQKYSQRPNSTTHIYVPPDLNIVEARILGIVEGEFKALSLWQRGIPAIGIKGFHGFGSPGKKGDLHPELITLLKKGKNLRAIEFLGDTDTTINKNFPIAAIALLEGLNNEGFSLTVTLPRLPFNGPKGIDDCFELWGDSALENWESLQRISLDPQEYKGRHGTSSLCFELFNSLDDQTLGKLITDGGKSERRVFETIAAMGETPRLQGKAKDRILSLEIPGLGKREINASITKTKETGPHNFSDGSKRAEQLMEIARKAHTIKGEFLYPRNPEDADLVELVGEETQTEGYMRMPREDFRRYLELEEGVSPEPSPWLPHKNSELDYVFSKIAKKPNLSYIGPVAGYPSGYHEYLGNHFLVPDQIKFIEGTKGESPMTIEYLQRLLGREAGDEHWEHQFGLLIGLFKATRKMLKHYKEPRTVPSVMFIGPRGCGKTHFQTEMLPKWIDGKYCICEIDDILNRFNANQAGCVITILSDPEGDGAYAIRKKVAQFYKKRAANPVDRLESKGKDTITVPSKKLIVASANDETEQDLAAIPPVDGIEDKVIYLRAYPVKMWEGSNDPKGKEIQKAIADEAEAFCYFIDTYELPPACQGERYGVATWQHPVNVEATERDSPSNTLAELIVQIMEEDGETAKLLFGADKRHTKADLWEIFHESRENTPRMASDVTKLGYILAHVKKSSQTHPEWGFVLDSKKINGVNYWVFTRR